MCNMTAYTGATAWWDAGYTGAGRRRRPDRHRRRRRSTGLDGAGKIVNGPDLSLESQAPNLRYLDTNGHGTFMAGLIAGNDATSPPYPTRDYRGMAPDARIVSIKVGDRRRRHRRVARSSPRSTGSSSTATTAA